MTRLRSRFTNLNKFVSLKILFHDEHRKRVFFCLKIGGRLRTIDIDQQEYEAGGTIIHEKNLYMKHFADKLGEFSFRSGFAQRTDFVFSLLN